MQKTSYQEVGWQALNKWLRGFGIFDVTSDMWCDFVNSHWPLHLQAAWQPWAFDDIKFLKSVWQGFVGHGRDHAPFEAHVYCPRFFHSVLVATFGDESVYRRLTFSISQTQQYLAKMSSRPWLKQYTWGISPTASPPASYLLLKRKKAFAIARPIIPTKDSFSVSCSKLFPLYLKCFASLSCRQLSAMIQCHRPFPSCTVFA